MKEPIDESIAGLAEIRPTGEDPAVDTGLDFPLEEGGVAEFWSPSTVVANEADGAPGSLICRI